MSLTNNFPNTRPELLLDFANVGRLDPRITFTRASTATYFNQVGVLTTAQNDEARFDYDPATLAARGLLIEESRTNSIRNNTMQGAVAGTPGTEPTNWASSTSGVGLTREIVGVGTENGIAYIDFKFSGTPTSGTNVSISCEGTNNIVASSGQTWTESVYVKLQAGAFTNTTTTLSLLGTNGTSGTESFASATITSTPSDLRNCRLSVTGTLANAGTTHIQPRVRIGYTVGVAFDITLRIGLPQLELGAFATSVIPTTTTALTRGADIALMAGTNFSSWYNASEGSLFCKFNVNGVGSASFPAAVCFDDGSSANAMELSMWDAASDSLRWVGYVSNSAQWSISPLNYTSPNFVSGIGTYKQNSFNAAFNGTLGTDDTSGTVPTVNRLLIGQNRGGLSNFLNGCIQRIAYYDTRLTNAQLQALTL